MRKKQWVNSAYQTDSRVLSFLKGLPDSFEQKGVLIWNGRNKIRNIDGLIIKRYKHPNLIQRIGYIFRRHKGHKAFENGLELIRRGFDTPCPIAAAELWKGLTIDTAYYICEPARLQASAIEKLLDREDWDQALARAFAHFAVRLHGAGILHNDLNDTNVLFEISAEGDYHFSLIDINRMKFYPAGQPIPTREWIENLTRFTRRLDLFEFVIREYAKEKGLDEEALTQQALAQKRQHDRNRYLQKRILHPFKAKKDYK